LPACSWGIPPWLDDYEDKTGGGETHPFQSPDDEFAD